MNAVEDTAIEPSSAAIYLLSMVIPAREREAIPGDLIEEYRTQILPQRGRFGAWLWCWSQVFRSLGPLLWAHRKETGLLSLTLRGLLVLIASYAVIAIPVIVSDAALVALFPKSFSNPQQIPVWYIPVNLASGFLFLMIGGYFAARIAVGAEIKLAFACLLIWALCMALPDSCEPLYYKIILGSMVLPGILSGGYVRYLKLQRQPLRAA
jgi:hypothetical protein